MMLRQITPEFVDEIPRALDAGKLYVCCRYRAIKHLCACGCGVPINTPLHPTAWTLICDGVSVTLWPSIGNWSEECQSHYWIRNNTIYWASRWSRHKILKTRATRDSELDGYFRATTPPQEHTSVLKGISGLMCSVRDHLARVLDSMRRRR